MNQDVIFLQSEGVLTVSLPPEIDHHTAKSIREKTDRELFKYSPRLLVLDFSRVSFMDSSGIGLIIGRSEVCTELGASIRLKGLSERNKKLLRLSGIEKITNLTISDV